MGLESIALAVSHLEEQASTASSEEHVPPIPRPRTLGLRDGTETVESNTGPRIVSLDHSTCLPDAASSDEGYESDTLNSSYLKQSKEPTYSVPPPDEVITKVGKYDVLCGRGGETNHNSGNVWYRKLVKKEQPAYLKAKRRDKPLIARSIVQAVRRMGGRFLKKDVATNTYRDVGNKKAREKTSQALREGAPELRVVPCVSTGSLTETAGSTKRVCAEVSPPRKKQKTTKVKQRHVSAMAAQCPQVSPVSSTDDFDLAVSNDGVAHGSINQDLKNARGPRLRIFKARMSISS